MKMGTIASPWRYDFALNIALPSPITRVAGWSRYVGGGLVLSCPFGGSWPHDLNVLIVEVWVLFTAPAKAFHSRGQRTQSDLLAVPNNSTKGEQFDEAVAKINYRVLMLRPYLVDTDIWTTELSHPARVNPQCPVRSLSIAK